MEIAVKKLATFLSGKSAIASTTELTVDAIADLPSLTLLDTCNDN